MRRPVFALKLIVSNLGILAKLMTIFGINKPLAHHNQQRRAAGDDAAIVAVLFHQRPAPS